MDEAQFLALPEAQRKELQKTWQQQGIYAGPIDGKSGNGVRTALTAMKAQQSGQAQTQLKGQELELERIRLEQAERKRLAEEEAARKAAEQSAAREQAADPLMDTFVPFAGGAGVGALYGELANRGLNKYEAGNAKALNEIAREIGPTKNLTGSQLNRSRAVGAAQAAERFAPSGPLSKALSSVGRASSYGIPAGVVYNEYTNYQGRANDPNLTEKERKANQQIANGLLGVTTGIGVEGGRRFFFPSRPEGIGTAQMRIDTARDFARRMDANDARPPAVRPPEPPAAPAAPRPALPGSRDDLMAQARRYGIKGRSNMSPDQLRSALADAITTAKAPRGGAATKALKALGPVAAPLAAGAVTYDAMRSPSVADDGSQTDGASIPEAAAAGTAIGGATYGAGRLAQAVPALGRALGPAATALSAYDYAKDAGQYGDAQSPELRGSPLGKALAGVMPLAMRGAQDVQSIASAPGRLGQALQSMPQLPPSEGSTMYGMEPQAPPPQPSAPPADPMMTAAALQTPQNVDPNATAQADIASGMEPVPAENPFPPQIDGRVKRMLAMGATPQQVASFLNSAIR